LMSELLNVAAKPLVIILKQSNMAKVKSIFIRRILKIIMADYMMSRLTDKNE